MFYPYRITRIYNITTHTEIVNHLRWKLTDAAGLLKTTNGTL